MKTVKTKTTKGGQALIVLLFYMVIAISLTTTAVAVIIANSLSVTRTEEGAHALEIAESGAENALIRLMRDTNYLGEITPIDGGSATITVTGAGDKTIVSEGIVGNYRRSVQVTARFTNGVLSVLSWQEI